MRTNFHRIAYEALDVCNALERATRGRYPQVAPPRADRAREQHLASHRTPGRDWGFATVFYVVGWQLLLLGIAMVAPLIADLAAGTARARR